MGMVDRTSTGKPGSQAPKSGASRKYPSEGRAESSVRGYPRAATRNLMTDYMTGRQFLEKSQ
jgi:hypothetical protein